MPRSRSRKSPRPHRHVIEAVVVAVLLLLFAGTAAAEHEADHRYDVRGYVLDAGKKPRSGIPVSVMMAGRTIGSGRTDGEGFYSIRLHLHDADIGGTLTVRAGNGQADIRMQAERGDQTTARLHHLNFVGGRAVEEDLSGGVPVWAYVAAAPVLLWAAVYVTGATRRTIRRAKSGKGKKGKGKGK